MKGFLSVTVIFELQTLISALFTSIPKGYSVIMFRSEETPARGGSHLVMQILKVAAFVSGSIFSAKSLGLKSHLV